MSEELIHPDEFEEFESESTEDVETSANATGGTMHQEKTRYRLGYTSNVVTTEATEHELIHPDEFEEVHSESPPLGEMRNAENGENLPALKIIN